MSEMLCVTDKSLPVYVCHTQLHNQCKLLH